jgi:hypothetical protein
MPTLSLLTSVPLDSSLLKPPKNDYVSNAGIIDLNKANQKYASSLSLSAFENDMTVFENDITVPVFENYITVFLYKNIQNLQSFT